MFGKIFSGMFDGTLATVGPWEALVTFQQFIVLADKYGVVDMTAGAISRRTTVPLEIIQKGIDALEQPDPESRTPDEDGRRIVRLSNDRAWGWQVVNYEHYRNIRSADERREYMKNYHREYRKQRKQPVNNRKQSKPPVNTINKNKPRQKHKADAEVLNTIRDVKNEKVQGKGKKLDSSLANFEKLWRVYPARNGKKLGKAIAQKMFFEFTQEDQLKAIQAAENYSNSELVQKGYGIKDAKRFLQKKDSQEDWRDWIEPEIPGSKNAPSTCSKRIEDNGRFKPCGKPATKAIRSNPLCDNCHAAYLKERQTLKAKGESSAD